MRFSFDSDQLALRDALRDMLAKECPPQIVRDCWDSDSGINRKLWKTLAESGMFGLLVPESLGGMGMSEIEMVLIMEEIGKYAVPGPVLEHCVAAIPLMAEFSSNEVSSQWPAPLKGGRPRSQADWLAAALEGDSIATFAESGDLAISWGSQADLILIADGSCLKVLGQESVSSEIPLEMVDRSHKRSELKWNGGIDSHIGPGLYEKARNRAALAASAQLLGLADRMIGMTVEYVTERKQFGSPVGANQAIKHHLANALLALEFARPPVYRAAYSMAHNEEEVNRDVSFAKIYASKAGNLAARVALQCHGAIGYSYEHDLHLWMKRVWVLRALWGDDAFHYAQVADCVLNSIQTD